jgi:hypothetical protein
MMKQAALKTTINRRVVCVKDNRRYLRTSSNATVIVSHPSFGSISAKARDLSDGGIAVDMANHISPPVGTVVDVIIKRYTGVLNAKPIPMIVKHIEANGIVGLAFI